MGGYGAIIGGVAGGIGGGIFGGGPAGAFYGASAGAAIGGGIDGYTVGQQNAEYLRTVGAYNSQLAIQIGEWNADAVTAIGSLNASIAIANAQIQSTAVIGMAEYNANLQRQISELNATLLENEAEQVVGAVEVDVEQYRKRLKQVEGSSNAQYGASGIALDEPGDAPAEMLIDIKTETELEVSIMRYNGDVQAGRLLDAAAVGRWEGNAMASQMLYEGYLSSTVALAGGAMTAGAAVTQAAIDAGVIRYSSQADAYNILRNAEWGALQQIQAGNQALSTGIISAMGVVGSAYASGTFTKAASTAGTGRFPTSTGPHPPIYRAPDFPRRGFPVASATRSGQTSLLLS